MLRKPAGIERDMFRARLHHASVDPKGRRWLFVPYDQLSDAIGPLSREPVGELGIVLVEAPWKAAQRPYHKQKLAFVLANLRSFALEQAARGVAVRHVVSKGSYAEALEPLARELGGLRMMEAAERELREDVAGLVESGKLTVVPHEGWLTQPVDFAAGCGRPPWRMDAFYRHVRRRTGILMEDGAFVGGRLSFDTENREAYRGDPPPPRAPAFDASDVKDEVIALVRERFAHHPGEVNAASLPTTLADAERLWAWAKEQCLPWFGPYEDAMASAAPALFHTRISPLLNVHRLLPARVVREAEALPIPLASKEGFIRQILGWREFMRHVFRATDGFRALPDGPADALSAPGDGGYARWAGRPWKRPAKGGADGGATPSALGAAEPLPPAYWGTPSGLRCLDVVVEDVWRDAWSHHITRLMILGNVATLLDVSPRELTDWFWVAYMDAYDWVVEPNVLGMATYGTADLLITKPYVSGAAYIHRMSDFCEGCAFDPKKDCPITRLYWAFLARHEDRLQGNPRIMVPLRSLARRSAEDRREDARTFERVRDALVRGERLAPPRASAETPRGRASSPKPTRRANARKA